MTTVGISLKVKLITQQGIEQEKTMKFPSDVALWEVCKEIAEKTGIGGADHGIFVPPSGMKKGRWLHSNNTLKYYDIMSGTEVYYKKKHRMLKVKLVDGACKTVLIDDSSTVGEIAAVVCKKVQINNPEEYSLRVEGRNENEWLNHHQTLHDQDVKETDTLILGKKFFFFDANIDRSDPVQLHLFYSQTKEMVLQGKFPLTKEEAIHLAAIQLQISHGDYNPERIKKGFMEPEKYLPPNLVKKFKSLEKEIYAEYKKLINTSEINAKYKYVHAIRSLKTFGITTFACRERGTGKKKGKWIPVLIGIAREKILRMDPDDMKIIKEYPLTHLKRWAAKTNTFTFDFGDHEEDYYQVQTTEGDAMSQLISGYIDIILRSRMEKARERAEDSGHIAQPEMINPQIGFSTQGLTSSFSNNMTPGMVMQPGQMPNYQNFNLGTLQSGALINSSLPESKKVNVIDMRSAQKATALLSEELEKDGGAVYEPYDASITIDQVKNLIGVSAQNIEKALAALIEASGPENVEIGSLNNSAKMMTSDIFKLANMARVAASIGGSNDVDIVTGAQKVAAAISRLMECAQKVADNPHDPKTRAAFENAARELREAMLFLKNAKEGKLNDIASEELMGQIAENLNEDIDEVIKSAMTAMKTVKDGVKMREIANLVKALTAAEKSFQETVKVLAAAMIDPVARDCIISASNELAKMTARLLELVRNAGVSSELVEALNKASANVSATLNQLLSTIPLAEPRSGADLDFQVPHSNILAALAQLRESNGDTTKVLSGIKAAVANTNELCNYAKKVAEASDSQGQQRLNNIISSVNDAVAKLITAAKEVAQKPNDAKAFENLLDTTHVLEALTQELVTDAGSSAATIALRYRSKDAATRTIKMLRALQVCSKSITDPNLKQQIAAQIEGGNIAVQQLIEALKPASQEPQNHEAQMKLLQTAQQILMPASQIVASTKRVAPGVADANQKQALNYSANALSEQLQKLMNAIKNVSDMDGQHDIEEAMDQFNATNADIEAAEFAAEGGFLVAPPGQTRDDAIELLDQSVSLLLEELKVLEEIAKDPKGRKIGDPAKKSANAAAQVAAAVKTVASTTKDKQMQKIILAQAKKFNKEVASVVSSARALVMNKKSDPVLIASLSNAQQQVRNALSSLNAAARGLDSREVDEAMELIATESEKLSNVKSNNIGGDEHKAALANILSTAKAMKSALVQLANVARANPKALGPTAKLAVTTVQQFFNASKVAAQNSPNQGSGDVIISSAQDLALRINQLLTASKDAASRKDQTSYQNLNNALTSVSKAIEGLSERNQFPEVSEAMNRISEFIERLENPKSLQEGNMSSQQILNALEQASHTLSVSIAQLVSASRIGSEKIGLYSQETSNSAELLTIAALSSLNPGKKAALSPQSAEILKLTESILENPGDENNIKGCAKNIAMCASKIIGGAKTQAQKLQDRNLQQSLLKAAHSLATATSKLARVPQIQDLDERNKALVNVVQELKDSIHNLESHNDTKEGESIDIDNISANKLINATKNMNTSILALIKSASALVSATDNEALSQELSVANKNVTDALSELVKVSNAFNPGKVALDGVIDIIQKSIADLDSASIQLAIGKIESKEAPTKNHQEWQDEIVNTSRDLATTTSSIVDSFRQDSNKLKEAAENLGLHIPRLVIATKATASTTTDPELQSNLISFSKELAESMLSVAKAAKEANSHSRESQQFLIEKSTRASQSIGKLVSLLKANVVIYQELETIADKLIAMIPDLEKPTQSSRQYNEVRDSATNIVMSIADKTSAINSADKTNLGNVAVQAKQLLDIFPEFVALAREASFVTKEADAKKSIIDCTKEVLNNVSSYIKKLASPDPNIQSTSSEAFSVASLSFATVLKALKSGSTGEILIEKSIETIKKAITILNQSAIFAQANQLDPSPDMSTISVGAMQKQFITFAEEVIPKASSLAESSRFSQEEFGSVAIQLSSQVLTLAEYASKGASKIKDNVSQQNILNATKALCITSQQLVLTGREAQRNSTPSTLQQMSSSVDSIKSSLSQLIQVLDDSLAEATRSEKDLEEAKTELLSGIQGSETYQGSQAEDIIRAAKDVTRGVSELVFASNQEAILNASKSLVESTKRLLATSRGATELTDDPNIKKELIDSSVAVANSVVELFETSKLDRNDDAAQLKIEESASDVTTKLSELVKTVQKLPNTQDLDVEELSTDMGTLADNEMDKTAKIILDAAKQLEESYAKMLDRKKNYGSSTSSQQELERLIRRGEISEQILLAAKNITMATALLMEAATVCQKERKQLPGKVGQRYRMDPTWNNGLISAARAVSDAVVTLVKSANLVLEDKIEEEALIVSARMIAASTAQLVTASRVRGPSANSPSQNALTEAAKKVANATNELLEAAKKASEEIEEEQDLESSYNPMGGKIKEFEEQMKILKLEKELMNARRNLGNIRRAQYEKGNN